MLLFVLHLGFFQFVQALAGFLGLRVDKLRGALGLHLAGFQVLLDIQISQPVGHLRHHLRLGPFVAHAEGPQVAFGGHHAAGLFGGDVDIIAHHLEDFLGRRGILIFLVQVEFVDHALQPRAAHNLLADGGDALLHRGADGGGHEALGNSLRIDEDQRIGHVMGRQFPYDHGGGGTQQQPAGQDRQLAFPEHSHKRERGELGMWGSGGSRDHKGFRPVSTYCCGATWGPIGKLWEGKLLSG